MNISFKDLQEATADLSALIGRELNVEQCDPRSPGFLDKVHSCFLLGRTKGELYTAIKGYRAGFVAGKANDAAARLKTKDQFLEALAEEQGLRASANLAWEQGLHDLAKMARANWHVCLRISLITWAIMAITAGALALLGKL